MKSVSNFVKKSTALLLCAVMLVTGNSVIALKTAVAALSDFTASVTRETPREISLLLDDIENFSTFSSDEKALVYAFLENCTKSSSLGESASSMKAPASVARVSPNSNTNEKLRPEAALFEALGRYSAWSECSKEDRRKIIEYINPRESKKAYVERLFSALEKSGADLYESVSKIKMLSMGIFEDSEVDALFSLYPSRGARDSIVYDFYRFSLYFDIADLVESHRFAEGNEHIVMQSTYTDKQLKLRNTNSKYLDKNAFEYAKQMLIDGAKVYEIEQFFITLIATNEDLYSVKKLSSEKTIDKILTYSSKEKSGNVDVYFRDGIVTAYTDGIKLTDDAVITSTVFGSAVETTIASYNDAAQLFTSGNQPSQASYALRSTSGSGNLAAPVY
ncbi:MAG: hypothetical protein IJF74_05950, partial [Clostridia bacterium]|nr:hypothetical protein [Clostridia bacterium]